MTSAKRKGLSADRIIETGGISVVLLQCSICQNVLWKPVACQICEMPYCSLCIERWLAKNPNQCPNECENFIERKCPPFVENLLGLLKVSCFFQANGCRQVVPYQELEEHELECVYQSQRCSGCSERILKKKYDEHMNSCPAVVLKCDECQLVYKRGEAATKHTPNLCLKEQIQRMNDESKQQKEELKDLTVQFNKMRTLNPWITQTKIIFDDLPSAIDGILKIRGIYKGFKWTGMSYGHEDFFKRKHPKSGYAASFMTGGSPHIAYFDSEASIVMERPDTTFTLVSISAAAAWNDNLKLTMSGYEKTVETYTNTVTLLFGRPQSILLRWNNIDKITLKSSGGKEHAGNDEGSGPQAVITQVIIDNVAQK